VIEKFHKLFAMLHPRGADKLARAFREPLASFRSRRRAIVLVLTLWVVIVLGLIAASLAFEVQVGSKLALVHREQFLAYNLAKSAIAAGMTHLQNDLLIQQAENPNQTYDAISDVWAQPERKEKDIEVEVDKDHPERTYEVDVSDEEGKLPINNVSPKIFKAMLEYYGYEPPDSDEVAAALVDYRDQDDMAANAPGEKENEHYSAGLGQRIERDMDPNALLYRCSNEAFLTCEQLLDVYGIMPEIYYGYDPADKAERDLRARDAVAQGRTLRARRERKKKNLALPLKDIITVHTTGKVNLNTAPVEVLAILLYAGSNFASLDAAQTAAENIADFRGDGKKIGRPDPDNAFKSLADVQKVPGVDPTALNQLGGLNIQPVFNSEVFSVHGIGRTAKAQRTITAVVERKLEVYDPNSSRLEANRTARGGQRSERRRSTRRPGEGGSKLDEDDYVRIPAVRVIQWIE
jgi:type II secretory pathway component PulK